jgi:hypothetical protein
MNPGQFVDRMRVEAAQQWIDSSSMGLKEIAEACGFQSADSMRRTFLRVLGVSAAEYATRSNRRSGLPGAKGDDWESWGTGYLIPQQNPAVNTYWSEPLE